MMVDLKRRRRVVDQEGESMPDRKDCQGWERDVIGVQRILRAVSALALILYLSTLLHFASWQG